MAYLRVLLVLAAGAAAGCSLLRGSPEEYMETPVLDRPFDAIWDVTAGVLRREFGGVDLIDPSKKVIESAWDTHLHPKGMAGYRSRGIVEVVEEEKGYRIRVRVRKQGNHDVWRPLDFRYAEWQEAPDDGVRAERVRWLIETELQTGSPPASEKR
jgi:hypothetical protein